MKVFFSSLDSEFGKCPIREAVLLKTQTRIADCYFEVVDDGFEVVRSCLKVPLHLRYADYVVQYHDDELFFDVFAAFSDILECVFCCF